MEKNVIVGGVVIGIGVLVLIGNLLKSENILYRMLKARASICAGEDNARVCISVQFTLMIIFGVLLLTGVIPMKGNKGD